MNGLTLEEWRGLYAEGGSEPARILHTLRASLRADDPAWVHIVGESGLDAQLSALAERVAALGGDRAALPLYGVPFAVKDNIDVQGMPTTAGCPAYAYEPAAHAFAVARLVEAGAIVLGKTNLDQFATGLVGTRSPYGAVANAFDPTRVSGGSSSGSADVVARGIVPFSLGTDTAGSGRVPAGFNNIVGLKPTRGWLSTRGVVPACRSLDCVSVFALTVDDAELVARAAAGYDEDDPYSRQWPRGVPRREMGQHPRLAVPEHPEFHADAQAEAAWQATLARLRQAGVSLVPVDFSPMRELAKLLYEGPFVAERHASLGAFVERHPAEVDPVVAGIVRQAQAYTASELLQAEYLRMALKRRIERIFQRCDALLVPTAPTHPTLQDVRERPVAANAELGYYTNFVNLADCSALALPAGMRADGLPFGVTLVAPAWHDCALANFGRCWQQLAPWTLGATGRAMTRGAARAPSTPCEGFVRVAVAGAHLSGMPLNYQLVERDARLVERTTTAPAYRLYALTDTVPPKPGLARASGGAAIDVEVWDIPVGHFGSFVALVPAPLAIGTLELADGRCVKGFVCEPWVLAQARDITAFGGWRNYLDYLTAVPA
ncbi:allophanate hydrolase [Verticiella sediminum]|uniref:Allophanate hydrolase n=1 Tax=Verticiella sediminum TaxID=1247510 RepID=A0A556AZ05_9BURK|nr:allophanate hydrolase [Verticiella sediminum]